MTVASSMGGRKVTVSVFSNDDRVETALPIHVEILSSVDLLGVEIREGKESVY